MPEPNLSYLVNLKPEEIIKWYESKGNVISWDWQEVYAQAHAKSFTVTKAMKLDILQTIKDEYINSLEHGNTPRDFSNNLEPTLKKLGWWGKQKAKDVPGYDPKSGIDPEKVVQLGSPHRLQKIFRINSTVSYNAQRYKFQMENTATHPYLQYIQVQRPSKRDEHAKFDKKVFRYDDPIVSIIYPPSDWECKCRMVGKSAADLKREGLKVSSGKDFDTSDIPEEWRHNPGEAFFDRKPAKELPGQKKWNEYNRTDIKQLEKKYFLTQPELIPKASTLNAAVEQLANTFGVNKNEKIKYISTPAGDVIINYDLLSHMVEKRKEARERYANYILPTLQDPFEIYQTRYDDNKDRLRYIGLFEGNNNLLSVVTINRDGNLLWNVMQADDKRINDFRKGWLIYGK